VKGQVCRQPGGIVVRAQAMEFRHRERVMIGHGYGVARMVGDSKASHHAFSLAVNARQSDG
jgi:hypothetical protein